MKRLIRLYAVSLMLDPHSHQGKGIGSIKSTVWIINGMGTKHYRCPYFLQVLTDIIDEKLKQARAELGLVGLSNVGCHL